MPLPFNEIERFASGTSPAFIAALWNRQANPDSTVLQVKKRSPIFNSPVCPNTELIRVLPYAERQKMYELFKGNLSYRQKKGDRETVREGNRNLQTGENVTIRDGFHTTIPLGDRDVFVFIDTETDPILHGIIDMAKESFSNNPSWSLSRKIFEICLLCFGNWGQDRFALEEYESNRFMLGELIWCTKIQDFECMAFSLALQVIGQKTDLPIKWYGGKMERFSTNPQGAGRHSYNIACSDNGELVVDLTNYQIETLQNAFSDESFRMKVEEDIKQNKERKAIIERAKNGLWEKFIRVFGNFPLKEIEKFPPKFDDYDKLISGDHLEFGLRNKAVYFDYQENYLFSCSLPGGWE